MKKLPVQSQMDISIGNNTDKPILPKITNAILRFYKESGIMNTLVNIIQQNPDYTVGISEGLINSCLKLIYLILEYTIDNPEENQVSQDEVDALKE